MKYFKKEDRRLQIIEAAAAVATEGNFITMTRDEIAARSGCSPSLINYHFKTMAELSNAVAHYAINTRNFTIISQIIVSKYEIDMDINLRQEALKSYVH